MAQYLQRALDEAAKQGEPLLLHLRACQVLAELPFELLALDSNFLLAGRVHLVRRVSCRGDKEGANARKQSPEISVPGLFNQQQKINIFY